MNEITIILYMQF